MTHADPKLSVAASAGDQSEALRCAEWLEHIARGGEVVSIEGLARTAAAQLRRLHALTVTPAADPLRILSDPERREAARQDGKLAAPLAGVPRPQMAEDAACAHAKGGI